jgi:hypothetical protein
MESPLALLIVDKLPQYINGGIQFGAGGVYIVALDPFSIDIAFEFVDIGEGTARAKFTSQNQEGVICFYEYGDTYDGVVKFSKIDRTNSIISGTFEFSMIILIFVKLFIP